MKKTTRHQSSSSTRQPLKLRESVGEMAGDEVKIKIDKFDRRDLELLKIQIENYPFYKKLHLVPCDLKLG
ncbi:unnamed protein product [Spirodela intermedia]|uniref:Uncharacterized protein n=1 Tax=Spirodela intermedia TaxID=51605 RepID=A0A7I8JC81_SPIIN|nr:unnamed protein product [Spirodela intermedia]CAA6667788.1 unnamed protein product [Spirodela intermedia]